MCRLSTEGWVVCRGCCLYSKFAGVGMIELRILGLPGPQGSKKFVGMSKSGRGILVESSAKVRPWRQAIAAEVAAYLESGGKMMTGPLDVTMVFTLPKPKSAKKNAVPDKRPDLSKLIRSTEDALTESGAWEDDARVVEILAIKRYPNEGIGALPSPGATIQIRPYTGDNQHD